MHDFLFLNGEKMITVKAYIYSFYYRFCVKHMKMKKLYKKMGTEGEESKAEESEEHIAYAKMAAFHVNRISEHLPWEEKCFVRALTLRKFYMKKGISCTIYMGVKMIDGKMTAHAWLRCGLLYMSGGSGKGYTVVTKFRT